MFFQPQQVFFSLNETGKLYVRLVVRKWLLWFYQKHPKHKTSFPLSLSLSELAAPPSMCLTRGWQRDPVSFRANSSLTVCILASMYHQSTPLTCTHTTAVHQLPVTDVLPPTHPPGHTSLPSSMSVDASQVYMCVYALQHLCWIWAESCRVLKHTHFLILPPHWGVLSLQNLFQQDFPLQTYNCIFLALTEFIVPGLMSPLSASGETVKCVCACACLSLE